MSEDWPDRNNMKNVRNASFAPTWSGLRSIIEGSFPSRERAFLTASFGSPMLSILKYLKNRARKRKRVSKDHRLCVIQYIEGQLPQFNRIQNFTIHLYSCFLDLLLVLLIVFEWNTRVFLLFASVSPRLEFKAFLRVKIHNRRIFPIS